MNKKELIEAMAGAGNTSKVTAEKALNAMLGAVTNSLKNGEKVTLIGFGTFSVVDRASRKAKNPRNGEIINIPAKKAVKFKAGRKLADDVK